MFFMFKHAAPRWVKEIRKHLREGDAESAFRIAEQMGHASPRTVTSLGQGAENIALLHAGALPSGIEHASPGLYVGKYLKKDVSENARHDMLESTKALHAYLGEDAAKLYGTGKASQANAPRYVEYLPWQAPLWNAHEAYLQQLTGGAPIPDNMRIRLMNYPLVPIDVLDPIKQVQGQQRLRDAGFQINNPRNVFLSDFKYENLGRDRQGNLKLHDGMFLRGDNQAKERMLGEERSVEEIGKGIKESLRDAEHVPTPETAPISSNTPLPEQQLPSRDDLYRAIARESSADSLDNKMIGGSIGMVGGAMLPTVLMQDKFKDASDEQKMGILAATGAGGIGTGAYIGSLLDVFRSPRSFSRRMF